MFARASANQTRGEQTATVAWRASPVPNDILKTEHPNRQLTLTFKRLA